MAKEINDIADLTPDLHNANRGTERGQYMIDHSIGQYGAGRSILVDADGNVIAGNKTLQAAADAGLPIVVVKTAGERLVVVQRTDLDLLSDDKRARLLAYADNRSSEVGLEWDAEQVVADLAGGLGLDGLFMDFELEKIGAMADIAGEIDDPGAQIDLPEQWMILVECSGEQEQVTLLLDFATRGIVCRALIS